jgi:glutamate racemase
MSKKKITIIVTDSGLGGMSVCAGIEEKLNELKSFEEVNLVYFNSHAEKGSGYNSMPNMERKAEVFNDALISMEEKYSPDLILIACNTLSVVYPFTEFKVKSQTPVLGIVDYGVDMIMSELSKNEKSEVILLGTETTIKSETHKNKLIEKGVNKSNIVSQACPGLESAIQDGPTTEKTIEFINKYVDESVKQLQESNEPILAAFCCTHYGFSSDLILASFNKAVSREVKILNPNNAMIEAIIPKDIIGMYPEMKVSVKVVSRALITETEKEAISEIVKPFAPLSAKALMNYEHNLDLFKFVKE